MKMTGKELKDALDLAFRIPESRAILNQVRLAPSGSGHGAWVQATDLEVSLQIELSGTEGLDGAVMLPAGVKKLLNGSDVEIASEGGKARVKTGRVNALLTGLDPADFPEFPVTDTWESVGTVDGELLARQVEIADAYASEESLRYPLNGVYWESKGEGLRIVGTDAKRLYLGDALEVQGNIDAILSLKGMNILMRAIKTWGGEVAIRKDKDSVACKVGPATIVIRKKEGQYPRCAEIIPTGAPTWIVKVAAKDLAKGLKEIQPFTDSHGVSGVALEPAPGGAVKLCARNGEMGQGEVALDGSMEGNRAVGIQHPFLVDLVKYIGAEEIQLEQVADASPIKARGAEGLHVLMPMRL